MRALHAWLPILSMGDTPWHEVSNLLRGWAQRLEDAICEFSKRTSAALFFRKHSDSAWHWAGIAASLGRPAPTAMDSVTVVEERGLDGSDATSLTFSNVRDGMSTRIYLHGASLRLQQGHDCEVINVPQIKVSADGIISLPASGHRLLIPPAEQPAVLADLTHMCSIGDVIAELPSKITSRHTITDPAGVKNEFTKWASETSRPAFAGPADDDRPSSLDEAKSRYKKWMDEARIPRIDG
eukprot:gene14762-15741_t